MPASGAENLFDPGGETIASRMIGGSPRRFFVDRAPFGHEDHGSRQWLLETGRVRYLIDGNNLLHAVAAHGPAGVIGRETLCRLLAKRLRREAERITVVFDGPTPPIDLRRQMQRPGLDVRFSGSETADEHIEREIAEDRYPASITVVTTDRAIQHAVRYRRATCIDSEQFVTYLYAPGEKTEPTESPAADEPGLTADETEAWLREFGDDLDSLPDDGLPWD